VVILQPFYQVDSFKENEVAMDFHHGQAGNDCTTTILRRRFDTPCSLTMARRQYLPPIEAVYEMLVRAS
jgi:hypothetical protein